MLPRALQAALTSLMGAGRKFWSTLRASCLVMSMLEAPATSCSRIPDPPGRLTPCCAFSLSLFRACPKPLSLDTTSSLLHTPQALDKMRLLMPPIIGQGTFAPAAAHTPQIWRNVPAHNPILDRRLRSCGCAHPSNSTKSASPSLHRKLSLPALCTPLKSAANFHSALQLPLGRPLISTPRGPRPLQMPCTRSACTGGLYQTRNGDRR